MMKKLFIIAILLCSTFTTFAQTEVVSDEVRKVRQEFQDRKFGIFVHWGIYSMMANGEWVMWNKRIDREEYSKLAGGFCPSWFSAREWAMTFKEAGAQYVTFTSRHHDGFSMFDTKASDYNIVESTPYHKDVLKDLADACAEQGLKLNLYYSLMDWYRPDYPLGSTSKELPHDEKTTNWPSYYTFMNQQLTELLTNYGPIGAIWFDGQWDHKEKEFDWNFKDQYALIKKLQPKCMIGNNHHSSPLPGEDFQLFEQDLPGQNTAGFNSEEKISNQLPLETCMTMNGSWGYNIIDTNWKSGDEIIRKLVGAAGRNANFLLNVGPRPDGQLPDQAVKILQHVGEFMSKYSGTIYNTRGGCVEPQNWGVTTQNGKRLYIHVLNTEKDGQITNDGIERVNGRLSFFMPIKKYSITGMKSKIDGSTVEFSREKDGYRIYLTRRPNIVDYIIEAHLN